MLLPYLSLLLLGFDLALGNSGYHYHRYMLADYRPQHTNKTQRNYLPVKRPFYPEPKILPQNEGPLIANINSNTTNDLQFLLVRIYQGKTYLCMGTLLTTRLVVSAASCFRDLKPQNLKIKTHNGAIHDLSEENVPSDSEALIIYLTLKKHLPEADIRVKVCNSPLRPDMLVDLPTYSKRQRILKVQKVPVLALGECRLKLKQDQDKIHKDTTICVQNKNRADKCQPIYGSPLVYKDQICGVNLLGHGCPEATGVDLYASLISETDYAKKTLENIRKNEIDKSFI